MLTVSDFVSSVSDHEHENHDIKEVDQFEPVSTSSELSNKPTNTLINSADIPNENIQFVDESISELSKLIKQTRIIGETCKDISDKLNENMSEVTDFTDNSADESDGKLIETKSEKSLIKDPVLASIIVEADKAAKEINKLTDEVGDMMMFDMINTMMTTLKKKVQEQNFSEFNGKSTDADIFGGEKDHLRSEESINDKKICVSVPQMEKYTLHSCKSCRNVGMFDLCVPGSILLYKLMASLKTVKELETLNSLVTIYQNALIACEKWEENRTKNALMGITKSMILRPFTEQIFNERIPYTFKTAMKLDRIFFNCHDTSYWWLSFDCPNIGEKLSKHMFHDTVPRCGYIVMDHGLLTMSIALNRPVIIKNSKIRQVIKKSHAEIHDLMVPYGDDRSDDDSPCANYSLCNETCESLQNIKSDLHSYRNKNHFRSRTQKNKKRSESKKHFHDYSACYDTNYDTSYDTSYDESQNINRRGTHKRGKRSKSKKHTNKIKITKTSTKASKKRSKKNSRREYY
jgi:hypothetical protein